MKVFTLQIRLIALTWQVDEMLLVGLTLEKGCGDIVFI